MKIINKISVLAILISISFISCSEKNEIITEQEQIIPTIDIKGIKLVTPKGLYGRASGVGMLSFNSIADFRTTVSQIAAAIEATDDAFLSRNSGLNSDQLDTKEKAENFDMLQPVKDFQLSLGFTNTYLDKYLLAEKNWLNKADLIEANDPDIAFNHLDEEELAVLNSQGAVQIGADIYKVFKGGYVKIPNANFTTLNRIEFYDNYNDFIADDGNDFIIYSDNGGSNNNGNGNSTSCFSEGVNRTNWYVASRRKMKGVVKSVYGLLWGSKVKSKTKYYKKSWGIWWRKRSDLTAALSGEMSNARIENCGGNSIIFDENIDKNSVHNKKKAKYVYSMSYSGGDRPLVEYHKVKGIHKQDALGTRKEQYLVD